jgi:putative membrane protein
VNPINTDLILAVLHHLGVFTIAGIIAAELALVRPDMTNEKVRQVSKIDALYGLAAGLVLLIGFSRVYFGLKGSDFYMQNPVFWAKIAAFVAVGVLSIIPTLLFISWRDKAKKDPSFVPSADEIASVRRYVKLQAHVFILIPIFAAAMARGFGL